MKKNQLIIESSIFIASGIAVIIGSLPWIISHVTWNPNHSALDAHVGQKHQIEDHRKAKHRWLQVFPFVGVSLVYVLFMKHFHFNRHNPLCFRVHVVFRRETMVIAHHISCRSEPDDLPLF